MGITAERVPSPSGAPSNRIVYALSEPVMTRAYPHRFGHVVLSLGRYGDTCVFPSDDQGRILDSIGFGYGIGPSRWLAGEEFDDYVADCIRQHESDDGDAWALPSDSHWNEGVAA